MSQISLRDNTDAFDAEQAAEGTVVGVNPWGNGQGDVRGDGFGRGWGGANGGGRGQTQYAVYRQLDIVHTLSYLYLVQGVLACD